MSNEFPLDEEDEISRLIALGQFEHVTPAPVWYRFWAYIVDCALPGIAVLLVYFYVPYFSLGNLNILVVSLAGFPQDRVTALIIRWIFQYIIFFVYFSTCGFVYHNQTLAKKGTGIQTIQRTPEPELRPPTRSQIIADSLIKANMIILGVDLILGLLSKPADKLKQVRLSSRLMGVIVVREPLDRESIFEKISEN